MPTEESPIRRIHYVLSSHWDREWYQSFQDFRRRLVQLMDRTLADIERGTLRGPFTTDGQAIVLEDYLEIRPERRAAVVEFLQTGKLRSGPWYVLPDEWLVSGESLIRNLQLGHKTVRDLGGEPSRAGFVCDLFGHISQLPQIFRGFGITEALIWRGVEPRASAQLRWRGSDGSELLCYRFGKGGYCDYGFNVRRINQPRHEFDARVAREDLLTFLALEAERNRIPPILILDGADHLEVDVRHYRILFEEAVGSDGRYEVLHSTLDAYLDEVRQHSEAFEEVIQGELREVGRLPLNEDTQWLIPGVLSSRVDLKQANAECESLLCHWAEPFSAFASTLARTRWIEGYLQVAWRWLITNHPHDSICGCSIDEVHEDMHYRFAQCRQIAVAETSHALSSLAAAVVGEIGKEEFRLLVAQPVPSQLEEPVTLTVRIPADWPSFEEFFGFERKPAFHLFDHMGREVPYQLLAQKMDQVNRRDRPDKFPETYRTHNVTICARLSLPAMGYTTLTVRPGVTLPGPAGEHVPPVRHSQTPGLAMSECSMANEFLAVTIEPNGTLTLEDKRSGEIYRRLLTFEDVADIGDGWFHGPAVNDQMHVSTGSCAQIMLVHNGSLLCQFRIRTVLALPEEFDFAKGFRSESFKPLVLDTLVGLRAGCDRVEIETTVDNNCKDHQLRVRFPTEVPADTVFSDGAFDVLERNIALPDDNHVGRELAVETFPQHSWSAVTKGQRGLVVVSCGQLECAVPDLPGRPLALTLFRATRRTVMTNGQPGGQLQGTLRFAYWIVPLADGLPRRRLFDLGAQLAAGVRCVQSDGRSDAVGTLPAADAFLQVEGGAVTTSVRRGADGCEVRLFNPETVPITARLAFSEGWFHAAEIERIITIDFLGRTLSTVECGPIVTLQLEPKAIVTLRLA